MESTRPAAGASEPRKLPLFSLMTAINEAGGHGQTSLAGALVGVGDAGWSRPSAASDEGPGSEVLCSPAHLWTPAVHPCRAALLDDVALMGWHDGLDAVAEPAGGPHMGRPDHAHPNRVAR